MRMLRRPPEPRRKSLSADNRQVGTGKSSSSSREEPRSAELPSNRSLQSSRAVPGKHPKRRTWSLPTQSYTEHRRPETVSRNSGERSQKTAEIAPSFARGLQSPEEPSWAAKSPADQSRKSPGSLPAAP